MNGIANILENNGKASYKDINSIKSNVYTGSIHLKKGTDTDVITVESIDINETFVLHISFMGAVIINSSMLS